MEYKNYKECRKILYKCEVGSMFLVVTLQDYIKEGE
jgi:hypothetical protein